MKNVPARFLALLSAIVCIFITTNIFSEPPNLALLRDKVIQYHDSGAYSSESQAITNAAKRYIMKRVYQNHHKVHPQKLAVVFDIDETALSNYSSMRFRSFVATKIQLKKDVSDERGKAIPSSLDLYKFTLRQGVAVFFITGRHDFEKLHTLHNLRKEGFTRWQGISFKPNHYHQYSVIPYKMNARKEIAQQGYTIIANIGDQCSDLKGGYSEATFKMPNPYYYIP